MGSAAEPSPAYNSLGSSYSHNVDLSTLLQPVELAPPSAAPGGPTGLSQYNQTALRDFKSGEQLAPGYMIHSKGLGYMPAPKTDVADKKIELATSQAADKESRKRKSFLESSDRLYLVDGVVQFKMPYCRIKIARTNSVSSKESDSQEFGNSQGSNWSTSSEGLIERSKMAEVDRLAGFRKLESLFHELGLPFPVIQPVEVKVWRIKI